MRKTWLALGLLPALAWAGPPAGVSVQHPWVRYLLPNIPAGAYLTLTNNGDTQAVLTGAHSPACGMLMLHESVNSGGTSMMMAVSSLTVPAHGSIALAEGGYHLMCMQPKMRVGAEVPITLDFQDGTSLDLTAPVYGPSGAP
ncbi:copper chaperone PCu(A)C [Acidocella sp. KAb 2-4]|uniref:copper chaperone PCu(A)C n=1 Tax=Acidocella sp. KAb 2-4 TaxID=2885158 RepID=UPI001D066B5E|nr:copper chaperone PCu(A)C [Acidocella sp. KAb 2-4]MCB5945482.1 copper chaperone PCu(A)C [Acidocella sp. KAb 2-4]